MSQELGELIRFLRKRAEISQSDLAKRLFVEQSSVSRWERGILQINPSTLEQLSITFDIPLKDFYCPAETLLRLRGMNYSETLAKATDNPPPTLPKPIVSYRIPIHLKLIFFCLLLLLGILSYIIILQNTTYSIPPYNIVSERYVLDSRTNQEVYEIACTYSGFLTRHKLMELKNELFLLWLLTPSEREDISVMKINYYKDQNIALQWGEPQETIYCYKTASPPLNN